MKISLFTQDADLTIVKDEMKVYRNGKVEKRLPISGKEEAAHLLSDIFHISVPNNYRLLP